MSFCTLSGFRPFQLNHLECMAGTTGLEPATSAVTVMLSDCKQMISWALMANYSTLEHSKTLGKTRISISAPSPAPSKTGPI